MQRNYKVTVDIPDNREYYSGIVVKHLDRFVRESEKLQGVRVKIDNLPINKEA